MKPSLYFANGLIFTICFFPYCSSFTNQTGSIGRQLDLIEDLENKLPEEDRPRFRKATQNIRTEEKEKDSQLQEFKTEAKESNKETLKAKEDSGKWYGLRNLGIFLFSLGILYILGKHFNLL
ncbi:hypothetical protein [Leptospira biflexa]|uniref:hypothetical protein n=1 Tax=Leptospira biflexa TaxID=172 RepID=UPI0010835266|nr:hypothetical protein [Leptospira biflexa]TGM32200.1 hypothetical protein EHQ80_18065 [Leptospira biflexa]TGM42177.1 hypothetical protein EHQ89_01295 [Leptospira biflexa]